MFECSVISVSRQLTIICWVVIRLVLTEKRILDMWWAGWPSGYRTQLQAGYHGFESRLGRDNFQTISTPSSYSTCPGLNIKWTGWRLVTDSGTKYAWVIHEN